MPKKISKLLGLVDEAPQKGHWLEGLRNAGKPNLPATTEPPNTSGLERMLEQPIDRRTFMERTGQAAQAASMANRLGGALGDMLPSPAPAEAAITAEPMAGFKYIQHLWDNFPTSTRDDFIDAFDMYPEQVLTDALTHFKDRLPSITPGSKVLEGDQLLEGLRPKLKDDVDEEYFQELKALLDMVGVTKDGGNH